MESDPPLSKEGQKVFASMLPLSRNTVHRWMLKLSEYGIRQIAAHNNRNLLMRKFRELICYPSMMLAKQRDTADEILAEFKHCLHTRDTNMRKKDSNVKASIEKRKNANCFLQKELEEI